MVFFCEKSAKVSHFKKYITFRGAFHLKKKNGIASIASVAVNGKHVAD